MKRISLIALCTLFILNFNSAFAGGDSNDKVGGIRAGWQISGIYQDGSKPDTLNNLNSFYVGIFKEMKIIPLLKFGVGLEFSQVGNNSNSNNIEYSNKLSYLYIPLYLKVKLGPVFALGGASPSFKVGQKMTLNGSEFSFPDNYKTNGFDIPLFLGLGVKIAFISIEARYNWGMINIYDFPNDDSSSKSQYFQIGAAVSF